MIFYEMKEWKRNLMTILEPLTKITNVYEHGEYIAIESYGCVINNDVLDLLIAWYTDNSDRYEMRLLESWNRKHGTELSHGILIQKR